jgi:hypothetical protein
MPRKVRIMTITKGKKRKTKVRVGFLLPILYIAYLLVGMIFGIWVNGHYYALEKAFYARRAELPPLSTPVDVDQKE